MYDPESIIQDADIEQAELEAEGREANRSHKRMLRLRKGGRDLIGAAMACHHGWGYPTDALAAEHNHDPRAGQPGMRCISCGSWWSGEQVKTLPQASWGGIFLHDLRRLAPVAPCELEAR
jgi:hypothetical protein